MGNAMESMIGRVLLGVLRFFQFCLAITVVGLYATDLNKAREEKKASDGRWVFAVVLGTMSAITSLIYLIPFLFSMLLKFSIAVLVWDGLLFFLWIVVFGIFGKLYIKEDAEGNAGIQRMKNAVWVVCTCMFLWLISTILAAVLFFQNRNARTRFTGRGLERA